MNSRTTTQEKKFINYLVLAALVLFLFNTFSESVKADWEIDLSRRRRTVEKQSQTQPHELRNADLGFVADFVPKNQTKEIVILNTKSGFVPSSIQLRKGEKYKIHLVNVNKDNKNSSFILDEFKEHHSTYFGQINTFDLVPTKEGIFEFQCPETSIQGRLVVYPSDEERKLATEKE